MMTGEYKTGLVMEGGAMRGMFTAGVTDVFMENGIEFAGAIGVSAGASFGCNYKSRQAGRAIRYNTKTCHQWRFASLRSWILTGDLYGADYCYHVVPEKFDPFDYEAYNTNPMEFYAVCTDVRTGKPIYHSMPSVDTHSVEWFRASSSMPIVSRIVKHDGELLLDGGISDSIPLQAFEALGYNRNVVILTRPASYVKKPNALMPLIRLVYRRYPKFVEAIAQRHIMYNAETAYVSERERAGATLVIRPEAALPVRPFERNEERLWETYRLGRAQGEARLAQVKEFLGIEN